MNERRPRDEARYDSGSGPAHPARRPESPAASAVHDAEREAFNAWIGKRLSELEIEFAPFTTESARRRSEQGWARGVRTSWSA